MDIAEDRPTALSLGFRYYHGNVCNHCGTTIKIVKKYDCLECHKKKAKRLLRETDLGRAYRATYRRLDKANRKQARVPWANLKKISEIYSRARELGMHVDHIIPLKHELVCGLHCEFNLQLLSPEENIAKRNRFEVL